jgi:hypothetical protein
MENWDNNNLPENHLLLENITLVAMTEGTWNRKKNDGTQEVSPKWDYISEADDTGSSVSISVYSATDKESIQLHHAYDLIVKKAIGKEGTFYGYSLKGFGDAGKPIPKKEPSSRWQKGQKLNERAEALKSAVVLFTNAKEVDPDAVIEVAEIFESYLNGSYKAVATQAKEIFDSPSEK